MDTYKGTCVLARRKYGNECILTSNCNQHNYCDNGYCICRTEFKMINDNCLPIAESIIDKSFIHNNINKNLKNNIQTNKKHTLSNVFNSKNFKTYYPVTQHNQNYNKMIATKNTNLANLNYNQQQMYALKYSTIMVKPGQYCNKHNICINNLKCISFICRCLPGWKLNKVFKCFPNVLSQSIDYGLQQHNLYFHKTLLNKIKIKKQPYELCNKNFSLCIANSSCVDTLDNPHVRIFGQSLCICNSGFIYIEKKCISAHLTNIKFIKIGENCFFNKKNQSNEDVEVCSNGSYCDFKNSICSCKPNQKYIEGVCINYALPRESCANNELCVGNSVCENRKYTAICICPIGMYINNGNCEIDLTKTAYLNVSLNSNIKPITKYKNLNKEKNLKLCEKETVCGEHSYCSPLLKICVCKKNFVFINNSCINSEFIRKPGENCDSINICNENSICKNRICRCINKNKCNNFNLWNIKKNKNNFLKVNNSFRQVKTKLNTNLYIFNNNTDEIICDQLNQVCPLGSNCIEKSCYCNSIKIKKIKNKKFFINTLKCLNNSECSYGLTCLQNLCVCIRLNAEENKNISVFSAPLKLENKINKYIKNSHSQNKNDMIDINNSTLINISDKSEENYFKVIKKNNINKNTYKTVKQSIPIYSIILLSKNFCNKFNKCEKKATCIDEVCKYLLNNNCLVDTNDAIIWDSILKLKFNKTEILQTTNNSYHINNELNNKEISQLQNHMPEKIFKSINNKQNNTIINKLKVKQLESFQIIKSSLINEPCQYNECKKELICFDSKCCIKFNKHTNFMHCLCNNNNQINKQSNVVKFGEI